MWDWFKKKSPRAIIEPQALAVAIAAAVRTYTNEVRAGRKQFPAHRRNPPSVLDIWRDLRLEALNRLFNYGQSDPFILSEHSRQAELLASFLDERAHLEMPQPRGEQIADTVQAMWQVYVYLSQVGSEVADQDTDLRTLQLEKRSILDSITAQAEVLRATAGPLTMLDALYDDVTKKAKSIALTTVFGPYHEAGVTQVIKAAADRGADTKEFQKSIQRVMAATDPDDL